MKIAHISDIHYSKSWMFREDLLKKCIDMVNDLQPDVTIITGDVTDYGLKAEFEGVKKYLDQLKSPYLIVPGNHDARYEGYKKFEEIFPDGRFFTKEIKGYLFIGLDSSEPDIDEGHIGRGHLKWLIEKLSSGKRAIIFLHHHLVPIPNTGRERNVLVDAGEVLKIIDSFDVPLILNGHKHVPWIWKLNDIIISTAGTVSCERTGVEQSFSIVDINEEIAITKINLLDGKKKKYVFGGKNEITIS
jgi:3',5'-cyclic AMP phosphodiesterase CpdA